MLTRIEIDGFKTFEGFHLDLGPFLVVLGANACGKSNLFDAIRLLSHLAGTDLRAAVKEMRGEPYELFRRQADGSPSKTISLAVEVLLDPVVRDPWDATVEIKHPRLRYEVIVERRRGPREMERLVVVHEKAAAIPAREDRWKPGGKSPSSAFKRAFMHRPGGTRTPFLETVSEGGKASFNIKQDGHAGRTRSAEAAEATVLSSITSAEFPHLYALREEMRSWRFLQLEPGAMRRPSSTTAPDLLEPSGVNLATVLARILAETASPDRPKGVIADIAADLAALIPGVVELNIVEDVQSREYRVDIQLRDGPPFSSRVVSDGTLRILALLTLLHDPRHRGLVCFEEPENGVHPFRLGSMIERLRQRLSDPSGSEVDKEEPLSQMLLNSHSPVVLSCLDEGEMVFADIVTSINPMTKEANPKTRVRLVRPEDQGEIFTGNGREFVTSFEVKRYLNTVDQGGMICMRYLGLALYAEGPTDYRFLSSLLRRLVESLCARLANDVIDVSEVLPLDAPADCEETARRARIREAALAARGAFSVLFVHTDGAGDFQYALRSNVVPAATEIAAHFEKNEARVVAVVPVRETEAWALADGDALRGAFGTTLDDAALGLPGKPRGVETIRDPKQALDQAFLRVVGKPQRRRKAAHHFEAISLRVRLDLLHDVPAFQRLEEDLCATLVELGYFKREGT